MVPQLLPPDRVSDGWRLVIAEDSLPVYVIAGNGPDRDGALRAGIREVFVLLGVLARMLGGDEDQRKMDALLELHHRCSLFLAGEVPIEVLAEAFRAVQVGAK